ncbi:MAG: 5'-nucleotidase C-terminal domain-containing protein [Prevotella sp.]|nr:5'-nucleotidase C-terminal domain-containing protein [Prevotella sp.]
MRIKSFARKSACAAIVMTLAACASHYKMPSIQYERIVIDSRYDTQTDKAAVDFLAPYKHVVDSIMGPVVGMVEHNMDANRPESDLSNLLSDILVWAGKDYNEQPVLGIYNVGGIRSALTKGKVTYGDVLAIAPFENKICFLTLSGEELLELFSQIASRGGEGVSRGAELVISPDGKLLSARLHGKEIDPKADYRVTTIDYLAQGNDGFLAFKKGKDLNAPKEDSNNSRFIIMNYFKEMAAKGIAVSAKIEGRIVVRDK